MGLDYGAYSREPKVREHIRRLSAAGGGWAGEDGYMVAVVLFTRHPDIPGHRAEQLLRALQINGWRRRPERAAEESAQERRSGAGRQGRALSRCQPEDDSFFA